jgi:hypothetical protein
MTTIRVESGAHLLTIETFGQSFTIKPSGKNTV